MNASLCLIPREPESFLSGLPTRQRSDELRRAAEKIVQFLEGTGILSGPPFSRAEHLKVLPTDPKRAEEEVGLPWIEKITVSFAMMKDFLELDIVSPDGDAIKTPLLVDFCVELDPTFEEGFLNRLESFVGMEFSPAFLIY